LKLHNTPIILQDDGDVSFDDLSSRRSRMSNASPSQRVCDTSRNSGYEQNPLLRRDSSTSSAKQIKKALSKISMESKFRMNLMAATSNELEMTMD